MTEKVVECVTDWGSRWREKGRECRFEWTNEQKRNGKEVSFEKWNKICRINFWKYFYLTEIILFADNAKNPEIPAGGAVGTPPH